MTPVVEHNYRFDSVGKLDADDWVRIPRAQVRAELMLDEAFGESMVQHYFEVVRAASVVPFRIERNAQGVRYRVPSGKTALLFSEPETVATVERVETSWVIAGGFLLAHRTNYGGRFYLGAEWDTQDTLKLYSTIRRYPPRLVQRLGVPLGTAAYRRTQGWIHQKTSARFLQEIAARVVRS